MANAIKSKNPDFKPAQVQRIVESKIGRLFWSSKKDDFGAVVPEKQGEPFYLKSTGRGTFTARPRSEKVNRRGRNTAERNRNIKISNVGRTKEEIKAANANARAIKATGQQVDHNAEVARTGRALRDMPSRLRRRQYRRGIRPGDRVENQQPLSGPDNRRKNRQLNALDKWFGKKEAESPSPSLKPARASRVLRIGNSGRIKGALRNAITISNIMQSSGARTVSTLPGAPHIFIP